jgi:hypothetical protein
MDFEPSYDPFASDIPAQSYEPPVYEASFGQQDPFNEAKELTPEQLEEQERQRLRDNENKERQKKLLAKDEKESLQREAKRKQAREELRKWHDDRNKLILRTQEMNLTKEKELLNGKASFNDATSWKKVASMIDFKENTERKEQARMKSVLLAKKHESK